MYREPFRDCRSYSALLKLIFDFILFWWFFLATNNEIIKRMISVFKY